MDPTTTEPAAHPLHAAVDAVDTAVGHLIKLVDDNHHTDLGAHSLINLLQDLERVRNKLPVADAALIHYGTEHGVPTVVSERTMIGVLTTGLRISTGEAAARVRTAEHLAERHTQLGEPLPPIREHLAAAQRDGHVTPEQVHLIDGALRKVRHCDPTDLDAGEHLLVQQATRLGYQDLKTVTAKLLEAIDPDGILPADEATQQQRRYLHLKHRHDGTWAGDFRLTPAAGEKLAALLGPLMHPRTTTIHPDTTDGTAETSGRKQVIDDDRTIGQRRHDAFEELLDACLRSSERPDTQSGSPATIILTFPADQFTHTAGTGTYADGTPCTSRTAQDLVDQADIAFCVKDAKGQVLDLARTRRIASPAQTLALIARDGGCTFPGCQTPPPYCERHHIIPWWDGGRTNLNNLTLLCSFHHRRFEKRGWHCQINPDGLPVWIPPRWIDPQQRPILNHRITITNWNPQDPLDLDPPDPEPDQ